jgi:hypothetical protein
LGNRGVRGTWALRICSNMRRKMVVITELSRIGKLRTASS